MSSMMYISIANTKKGVNMSKILGLILLFSAISFAGPFSNDKAKLFVENLKVENYDKAFSVLTDSSEFLNNNLNINAIKNQYVSTLQALKVKYGKPHSFEILKIKTMGSIEKTYYLVNCKSNAFMFFLTEYNNTALKSQSIVNFGFETSQDDSIEKLSK